MGCCAQAGRRNAPATLPIAPARPALFHCPPAAAGITVGELQSLQKDAAKWMAMASLLCESAGWWPLGTLYSNLAQVGGGGWERRQQQQQG